MTLLLAVIVVARVRVMSPMARLLLGFAVMALLCVPLRNVRTTRVNRFFGVVGAWILTLPATGGLAQALARLLKFLTRWLIVEEFRFRRGLV